jgi:hypothetical protein
MTMGSRTLFLCVTVLLLGCDCCCCWAATCPKPIPNWHSKNGGHKKQVRFINESPVDVVAYWVNFQGQDREEVPYDIHAGDSLAIKTTTGHRFRIYQSSSSKGDTMTLVKQCEVTSERGTQNVRIHGCDDDDDEHVRMHDVDQEMQTLVHDQDIL